MRTPVVRRGTDPSWMRPITERLSPVIKFLVIAETVVYAFFLLVPKAPDFFKAHLALNLAMLAGEPWQPLSSLFVHVDFTSFIFNMIGLWFVGATVERQLGTRRFLTMFFVSGVVANVVMVLVAALLRMPILSAGPGSAILALFIAFGVIFDRQQARILGGLVLESRIFTWILIGFTVVMDLFSGVWPALPAHIAAMLLGYVLAGGRGAGLRRYFTSRRAQRSRRRYQVLEGGRGHDKPDMLN